MFKNLTVFQVSYDMARHAGARQAVTAANIANADTPDYRARSLGTFADTYTSESMNLRSTRDRHLGARSGSAADRPHFADAEASPNGNTVSLEQEMINSVEIQREHRRALSIYKHSLDVMRMSLGRT